MRKCEKDFRQVFSFLFCLFNARSLSKFSWTTIPSAETIIRKEIGVFYCSPTKFKSLIERTQAYYYRKIFGYIKMGHTSSVNIRHGVVPQDCV